MDRRINLAALDVERFSKQGTEDLQRGLLENSLEAFKQAYKCSRELSDGPTERACAFNLGAAFIAAGQAKRGIDTLQVQWYFVKHNLKYNANTCTCTGKYILTAN